MSEEEITDYLINNDKKAAELYNTDRESFDFSVRTAAGSIGHAKKRMSSRSKSSGVSGAYRTVLDIISALAKNKKADYVITGQWAKKAYQEAKIYGDCKYIVSPKAKAAFRSMIKGTNGTGMVMENDAIDGTAALSTGHVPAKEFFYGAAGYIEDSKYKRWFK